MKVGLVLGGGGLVGMAYHAGALKALDDIGLDVSAADLMVGTSAGSVMVSYLAAGWTPTDFMDYSHGVHPDVQKDPSDPKEQLRQIFTPLYTNVPERVRRSIGSAYAIASSRGYLRRVTPGGEPGRRLKSAFPAGMYSIQRTRERFWEDLPEAWPRRDVFVCAVDLYTGERVAFGHPDAPKAPFPDAVLASTAIPGVFPPVKIGDRQYVDGGVATATSVDLAMEAGCEAIVCIAPMGYRSDGFLTARDPTMWPPMLVRSLFARSLKREVNEARARGLEVLVIRPWLTDLRTHGTNSMRHFNRGQLSEEARAGTLRMLEQHAEHPALEAWPRLKGPQRKTAV